MNVDFLDSNVLLYLFDETDERKRAVAEDIVDACLRYGTGIISFQVVQEVLNVLTHELGVSPGDARLVLDDVLVPLWTVDPSPGLYQEALRIHSRYGYGFQDAQIVAAAMSRGCHRLFTEDLHDGHDLGGLTIVDPFASTWLP